MGHYFTDNDATYQTDTVTDLQVQAKYIGMSWLSTL